ncbi:MAG: hypothetical protein AB1589_41260 [Cyanobacteriota bacterium]
MPLAYNPKAIALLTLQQCDRTLQQMRLHLFSNPKGDRAPQRNTKAIALLY